MTDAFVDRLHPEDADAEASYRRGYQQGAFAAVQAALRRVASGQDLTPLLGWAEGMNPGGLYHWRLRERPGDRNARPPDPP